MDQHLGSSITLSFGVVVLFAIWIIILDARAGSKSISPSLMEMAKSYGASPGQAFTKIYLWAALPEILAGIRLGLVRAVKGVIIGQLLTSPPFRSKPSGFPPRRRSGGARRRSPGSPHGPCRRRG